MSTSGFAVSCAGGECNLKQIKFDLSQGDNGNYHITSVQVFTKGEAEKTIKELEHLQEKNKMKIEISKIRIGKRIRQDMGDTAELAQSIKEEGLLSPIILRKNDNNTYKLLAGFRRLKACKTLHMTSIDAIVKKQS